MALLLRKFSTRVTAPPPGQPVILTDGLMLVVEDVKDAGIVILHAEFQNIPPFRIHILALVHDNGIEPGGDKVQSLEQRFGQGFVEIFLEHPLPTGAVGVHQVRYAGLPSPAVAQLVKVQDGEVLHPFRLESQGVSQKLVGAGKQGVEALAGQKERLLKGQHGLAGACTAADQCLPGLGQVLQQLELLPGQLDNVLLAFPDVYPQRRSVFSAPWKEREPG